MVDLDETLTSRLGTRTSKALASALELHTVGDLLRHYPRRYTERGELTDIEGVEVDEHVTIMARVVNASARRMRNRRGTILEIVITDGHRKLTCAFFNQKWREKELLPGRTGLFAGKVTAYRGSLQLAHPEYELVDADAGPEAVDNFVGEIIPVYPAAQGMQSWVIARAVRQVLDTVELDDDPLPGWLLREHGLTTLHDALWSIHFPSRWDDLDRARNRLKWDEAMAVQLAFAQRRYSAVSRSAPPCTPRSDGIAAEFDRRLPFALTTGQCDVGESIAADLATEHPMNRLLQGEVGSGKTIVALRAMLQVVDSGRQAAMLAPTEVLAAQHARSLHELLGDLARGGELDGAEKATRVSLLTGSMTAKERKQALLDTVSGAAGIVVGTHALIQDTVSFADLGLVVVDEQHRFGVRQRDALRDRGADATSPHMLVMTATPIPRTVAMTAYGDLEISSLRELPRGRSSISTTVVPIAEKPAWLDRVWQRIVEEIHNGNQAYVVCSRIGDEPSSDTVDNPAVSVLDLTRQLREEHFADLRVGVLHGRMPTEEKDATMRAFAAGSIDVLISTTVVEVGVNVPNATVMVVMDADRFGMSQLHQLRGRVGRGERAGLCLLVTESVAGTETRRRLAAVESTLDGFELSQLDLELRREGDVLGASQSGKRSGLRMLSLLTDGELITAARESAVGIVEADPALGNHLGLAHLVSTVLDTESAEYLEKS